MKTVDVLIIYELKSRELENSALIAAELERRGYSTMILYNYSYYKRLNIKAKVVIVPHVYNEDHLKFYSQNYENSNRNVISMQYEQILSESSEDGAHNPSGQAMNAQHIAWGQAQVDRYLKHGIEPDHINETGSVSMDLFRKEFQSYFLSREEIGKQFDIDPKKEWILFVSSFSYAKRTEDGIKALENLNPNARVFADISDASYAKVLEWLKQAAIDYPDKLFIYRKHPAEIEDEYLHTLEKELPNFRCINDYSMRQWSIVADKIYNWYSTSLADIYFAHKPCYILRPCGIPSRLEVSIMAGGDFLTGYDDFSKSIECPEYKFPVNENNVNYFFCNSPEGKMAFQNIADLCERMMSSSQLGYDYQFETVKKNWAFYVRFAYDMLLYQIGKSINTPQSIINAISKVPGLRGAASKLIMYKTDLYKTDKEVAKYKTKFSHILREIAHE